uniref:NAD(+) ADP-ribosyltransferase n=2 Tax=Trieres chinensis TaxID=1514140 RepID=A0A7S2EQ15_TRICV
MRFSRRLQFAARGSRPRTPTSRYDPDVESARPQSKITKRPAKAASTRKAKHVKPEKASQGRSAPQTTAGSRVPAEGNVTPSPAPRAPVVPSGSATDTPVVDTIFGIKGGELLQSPAGHGPLEASMNYIDPRVNSDKFYVIQAISNAQGSFVCLRWGRRGAKGQMKIEGPMDSAKAAKKFEEKFKAKTGLSFADRDADALDGKYKMEKRLREAGAGKGEVAVSLMWDNVPGVKANDLDLHVKAPSGEEIYYMHKRSACGGELDVDRMQDAPEPVENIVWKRAPHGQYAVYVNNFSASHSDPTPFKVSVAINGSSQMFDGTVGSCESDKRKVLVTKFSL